MDLIISFCSFIQNFDIQSFLGYVGPGPGVSFLPSLLALFGAIFTSIFLILLWPIRKLMKKTEKKKEDDIKQK